MIAFFRKLGWLARRRDKEEQLAAELQFHLEEEAAQREAAGMSIEDAQWAARRDLGNLAVVREDTRSAWSWTLLEQLLQDLRYGVRNILNNPAFTLLAALSLALGIGANTAIYSFLDALLLRVLPVPDPGSLVVVKWHMRGSNGTEDSVIHSVKGNIYDDPRTGATSAIFPYPAFEDLRNSSHDLFSDLLAYRPVRKLNVIVATQAEVTGGEYVSGGYFRGLAVTPAAGRLIDDEDDRPGARAVVVLGYGFARRRFGRAAAAVGQTVLINNVPFTAIGVAAEGFSGVDPSKTPQLYLPLHADLAIDPQGGPGSHANRYLDEHYYWTEIMARLRPRVTISKAQASLASAFDRWVSATASNERERTNLPKVLLREAGGGLDNLRRRYAQPFYILLGMVGLLLAIACANIANLLLARASSRRREIAVRLSMGAGRGRVIRQLLTESLLLAGLGGAAGVLVAMWGIRFLRLVLTAENDTFTLDPQLNWHVLAATLLLTMTTGLLFGLAPARQATRVDPVTALKETRGGSPPSRGLRLSLSQVLMVAQMAISVLLLVGAGLFLRTLSNLDSLDMGFRRENVLLFKLDARQVGHREPEILSFYTSLEKRFAAIPGVLSASAANSPLIGDGAWGWPVVPFGTQPPEDAPSGHGSGMAGTATRVLAVGPDFFRTMSISLLAGRDFEERDGPGTPPVAIVNEAWVKTNLPGRNPVGQRVVSHGLSGMKPTEMQVVGLAKNSRYDDLTGEFPSIVYLPYRQDTGVPLAEMTFFLRTAGDPVSHAAEVREIVRQADTRIPVTGLTTQAAQISGEMGPQALFARLCTAFAILALAIGCIGLYGTTSYTVARRTGEIGIRMALGAGRARVIWMVLRNVLGLVLLGLIISLPVAAGASRLVQALLYGVKPGDPTALAGAAAILLVAAVIAGYLPARRASRIDPMSAVRHE